MGTGTCIGQRNEKIGDRHWYEPVCEMLWPQLERESCVVWVGSGLSRPADYPGWQETVRELCSACAVGCLPADRANDPNELMDKAEECKQANLTAYWQKLAELFGHPVVSTRRAYGRLMKLQFKAYVTTNFDPLLFFAASDAERCCLHEYPHLPSDPRGSGSRQVYYIHGLALPDRDRSEKPLVLARSDFEGAYGKNGHVASFLTQLLTYNYVLFLGCSLREPDMRAVFGRVQEMRHRIPWQQQHAERPHWIALLGGKAPPTVVKPGLGQIENLEFLEQRSEDSRLRDMGIDKVFRYQPSDSQKHWEIEEFLDALIDGLDRRVVTLDSDVVTRG